jgi:YD repeat-containing protein
MSNRRQLAAVALSSSALIAALSIAGDTRYTYDALGRLVKVVRPDGVETNYTMDAAGNRAQVTEGAPPGPPPAPTGLQYNQNSPCSFYAQWNASTGATSYQIRDWSGNFNYSVSATNTAYSFCAVPGYTGFTTDYRPKWVKACNAQGCAQANFP